MLRGAAQWFHDIWRIPVEAYAQSMAEGLQTHTGVPRWYVALGAGRRIVAGLGVIDNDFHKRPDLTPNLCAVYVEEAFRHKGLARLLMDRACGDLAVSGVENVYLLTDHREFYERCGWTFYGMVEEDDGNMARCYHRRTANTGARQENQHG